MSTKQPPPSKEYKPVITSGADVAAAKKQQAAVAKMKAKERQRAKALAADEPKKKFRTGEQVEIVGGGRVNDDDVHGQRISTDHKGSRAMIGTSYFSPERQEHVHVTQTEDGQIRAVPESQLERRGGKTAGGRLSVALNGPPGLLPRYMPIKMNPAFCGERCTENKHCLDDHSANGDPEA